MPGKNAAVQFTIAAGLPPAPDGMHLRKVRYRTCPGSDLALVLLRGTGTACRRGVPADSWWAVRCRDLPDRVVRLFKGGYSLEQFVKRYGFLDATGCVNHKEATAEYAAGALPHEPLPVPSHLHDATGVPQFYPRSGVCWFATMCWTSFANPRLAGFLRGYLPADLRQHSERLLFDRDEAEAFRNKLWHEHAIGDDVTLDPSNDGRNGFTEFSVLCAKFGIPLMRFREEGGELEEMPPDLRDRRGGRVYARKVNAAKPHLLALRYNRGDHRGEHAVKRRLRYGGRRYCLMGVYMGQSKCGHQIGACAHSAEGAAPASWRHWSLGDADLHKDGIGPIHIAFDGNKWDTEWFPAWDKLVHVTKYGAGYRDMCNFSWHNPKDTHLDAYRGNTHREPRHQPGSHNMDLLYMSCE